jgi:hypothetical protein
VEGNIKKLTDLTGFDFDIRAGMWQQTNGVVLDDAA